MAEHTVVVVGSNQPLPEYTPGNFWVIDFSNAAAPTAVSVSCSSSGVVVDCSGSMAAVAAVSGDTVTIYDIANPASPAATGSASLSFNGIGAISFYGGYVLVGEASNDSGARVALIDISNLASPQVYATSFAQITDVTLFGSTAVICGLGGYSNAFQVATTSDFPLLATSVPMTDVSAWIEYSISFMCDFDGTNAVFSDGTSLYAYGIRAGSRRCSLRSPAGEEGSHRSRLRKMPELPQAFNSPMQPPPIQMWSSYTRGPPSRPRRPGRAAAAASAIRTTATVSQSTSRAESPSSVARSPEPAPFSPPQASPRSRAEGLRSASSRCSTSRPAADRSRRRGKARARQLRCRIRRRRTTRWA